MFEEIQEKEDWLRLMKLVKEYGDTNLSEIITTKMLKSLTLSQLIDKIQSFIKSEEEKAREESHAEYIRRNTEGKAPEEVEKFMKWVQIMERQVKIANTPMHELYTPEELEEMRRDWRKISTLSPEDLLRRFNI